MVKYRVYLELFLVTVLWGLVPLVMRETSQQLHSASFNLIRYVMAVLILAGYLKWNGTDLGLPWRKALSLMLLGALTMFPFSYFFLLGVKYVDISIAGMIQGTTPALTVVISVFLLNALPSWRTVLSVVGTYLGLLVFLAEPAAQSVGTGHAGLGMLYVFLAIIAFSFYATLGKKITAGLNVWLVTLYVCIGVTVSCVPLAVYEQWYVGGQTLTETGLMGALYMALFATVAALYLYTKAVNIVGQLQASLVTTLVPVVVIVSGAAFLKERITLEQMAAVLIVLVSVYLTIRHDRRDMEQRRFSLVEVSTESRET